MATAAELIEEIKKMSVLELSELVKALEEEFGVSATAVVAAAPAGAPAAGAAAATAVAETPNSSSSALMRSESSSTEMLFSSSIQSSVETLVAI